MAVRWLHQASAVGMAGQPALTTCSIFLCITWPTHDRCPSSAPLPLQHPQLAERQPPAGLAAGHAGGRLCRPGVM